MNVKTDGQMNERVKCLYLSIYRNIKTHEDDQSVIGTKIKIVKNDENYERQMGITTGECFRNSKGKKFPHLAQQLQYSMTETDRK